MISPRNPRAPALGAGESHIIMETQNSDPSDIAPAPVTKRQSLWRRIGGFSLSTAIIFHLLLLVGAALWVFSIPVPEATIGFIPPGKGGGGDNSPKHDVNVRRPSPVIPMAEMQRILAVGATARFSMPDPGERMGKMSALTSMGGSSMGGGTGERFCAGGPGKGDGGFPGFDGDGQGRMFIPLPGVMGKRCSKEDRLQRIRDNGGTPACEDAVVAALRWLKANQSPDGSWGGSNKVAMTGFALLSYFGHCENPASAEFGESCLKGIVYLVETGLRNDGKLASNFSANHWPYEHAIATYALAEAATFCRDIKYEVPSLMEVTEKAGQFIIDNQNANGGWAYLYAKSDGHTDVSVAGWQIQALKACSHTGIRFRGINASTGKGLSYLGECQNENGGYGYTGKNPAGELTYLSLSGVGMLCNQMFGKGNGADVRKASKYVLANTRRDYNSAHCDLYAHYYESQAMMQSGGSNWKTYNDLFRDQILQNQDSDGSWKIPGGGRKIEAVAPSWAAASHEGKIYRTCLCTLMLEVYYRFLNTDKGGRSHQGI